MAASPGVVEKPFQIYFMYCVHPDIQELFPNSSPAKWSVTLQSSTWWTHYV